MSRTDKDAPWWVQAERWEPFHYNCEFAIQRSWQKYPKNRECDLPGRPILNQEWQSSFNFRRRHNCVWVPDYDYRFSHMRGSAPKWFRDHCWNNMNRRRSRDEAIQARKEYNASGDVDLIMNVDQHRHCAGWLYW